MCPRRSRPRGSSPGRRSARGWGAQRGKAAVKSGSTVTPGQASSVGVPSFWKILNSCPISCAPPARPTTLCGRRAAVRPRPRTAVSLVQSAVSTLFKPSLSAPRSSRNSCRSLKCHHSSQLPLLPQEKNEFIMQTGWAEERVFVSTRGERRGLRGGGGGGPSRPGRGPGRRPSRRKRSQRTRRPRGRSRPAAPAGSPAPGTTALPPARHPRPWLSSGANSSSGRGGLSSGGGAQRARCGSVGRRGRASWV